MASSSAPTLADVAAHLGVSRTTVSNAYNRPNQLSPALREKVLAAAGRLGYNGPDPMARGLRRGQTGTLGLVFDQPLSYAFTDPAAALFLRGLASGLEEHARALTLIPRMPEGPERSAELVRAALIDGYIMFCTASDDPRFAAVRGRGLPYVLIEYDDDPDAALVQIDDEDGARAAAEHLTALGHRDVAIVSAYTPGLVSGPEAQEHSKFHVQSTRLRGWRAGLEAGGVDWSGVAVSGAGGTRRRGGPRRRRAARPRRAPDRDPCAVRRRRYGRPRRRRRARDQRPRPAVRRRLRRHPPGRRDHARPDHRLPTPRGEGPRRGSPARVGRPAGGLGPPALRARRPRVDRPRAPPSIRRTTTKGPLMFELPIISKHARDLVGRQFEPRVPADERRVRPRRGRRKGPRSA